MREQKQVPQGNRKYSDLEHATRFCAAPEVDQKQSPPTLEDIIVMGSLEAMRLSDQQSVAALKRKMSTLFDKVLAS